MKVQLNIEGKLRTIHLEPGEQPGFFTGELDGLPVAMDAVLTLPGVVSLVMRSGTANGQSFRCVFDRSDKESSTVSVGPQTLAYQVHDPRSLSTRRKRASSDEGTLLLKATMAGRVVRILAEVGDAIEAHGGVIVIEAMKMQNELRSQRAGRIVEVRVAQGEMVSAGQVLAVIE